MKRLIVMLGLAMALIMPATALAVYDPFSTVCSDPNNADSSVCNSDYKTNDPLAGTNGVIYKISTFISVIAGVSAVIMIVIGGFSLINSGGDPQKAASARKTIIGAAVGLFIIAAAQTIIYFVIYKFLA